MERMLAMNIGVEKYFSCAVMQPAFVKQRHEPEGFLNREE